MYGETRLPCCNNCAVQLVNCYCRAKQLLRRLLIALFGADNFRANHLRGTNVTTRETKDGGNGKKNKKRKELKN
jgi:hypothetical protein